MNRLQLVCILSIIAIALAGGDSKENEEKMKKFGEECKKEINASDEDLKFLDSDGIPKTKIQHCLIACYYKKTGNYNDDNTINVDKELEDIEFLKKDKKEAYEKLVTIIKDCNSKYTPSKECDSTKTYFECVMNSSKEL